MKVIKVVKHYRNGSCTFIEIVHGDADYELEEAAGIMCANDSSGQIYGYNYSWSIVTDPHEIMRVVGKRIKENYEAIAAREAENKQYFESFPELNEL